jgi:hypothetical protein
MNLGQLWDTRGVPDNPSVWFIMRKSYSTTPWIEKELRENFARASRAGRRAARTEPRARAIVYRPKGRALKIALTNGAAITLPVELISHLRGASPREISEVEILGKGGGLHWERLDLDLSIPGLLSSVFAGSQWLAELGRIGGRKSSAAKAAAARRNGRKGGRPRARAERITRDR